MPRRLYVDMDGVLDALETHDPEAVFVLDLETGRVDLAWTEGDRDEDPSAECIEIPKREPDEDHRLMSAFAEGVDEADVRENLLAALQGKGAFRRFRTALSGFPDLRARFEERQREALLAEALAWLRSVDVDPQYELRPPPVPQPPPGPTPGAEPRLRLYDLLVLGAPPDDTPREGRMLRQVQARNPEQARKLFKGLARDLCEHHGLAWRNRFIEDSDVYDLDGARLELRGARVDLWLEVPPTIRRLFVRPTE